MQQPSVPDLPQNYSNPGFDKLPVDLPGADSLGLGNIPSSMPGSNIPPSATRRFEWSRYSACATICPFAAKSVGMGQVPPSMGGSGMSPSVVSYVNGIDLRNPQPDLPGIVNPGFVQTPQSVAGISQSPQAINNLTGLNQSYSQPFMPSPQSIGTGMGQLPPSMGGLGASTSVVNYTNGIDLKNPQPDAAGFR